MAVRKFTILIFVTLVSSCLGVIICGVSLGTDFWYFGSAAQDPDSILDIRYGLFSGQSFAQSGISRQDRLKIVCMDGLCMFSCGKTKETREMDMRNVRENGQWDEFSICHLENVEIRDIPTATEVSDSNFFGFGLWLMTILFLSIAIAFFALAAGLALYNTFWPPAHSFLGVLGLYILNLLAEISVFLALLMYGLAFGSTLKKNPVVSGTLIGPYVPTNATLGFSYWILLLAGVLPIINLGVLFFRSWKIAQLEKVHHKTIDATLTSGDVLLF